MNRFVKMQTGSSVSSANGRLWRKLSTLPQLAAPALSIEGSTLTITDESKLATSFDIYVNGEKKATVTTG